MYCVIHPWSWLDGFRDALQRGPPVPVVAVNHLAGIDDTGQHHVAVSAAPAGCQQLLQLPLADPDPHLDARPLLPLHLQLQLRRHHLAVVGVARRRGAVAHLSCCPVNGDRSCGFRRSRRPLARDVFVAPEKSTRMVREGGCVVRAAELARCNTVQF
ncbi:hypothetical protein GUJ93_ZPchr0010g7379 [Zizania palustris]|uniref:Uncharacterized protein n=1 Tax=Zizania palustris TaxID=103762 RepID=A0A8J5WA47_ZIZPA|nr:hypothetical protein GUJ93_ZPchr0010g7379 [Zizania palustris]